MLLPLMLLPLCVPLVALASDRVLDEPAVSPAANAKGADASAIQQSAAAMGVRFNFISDAPWIVVRFVSGRRELCHRFLLGSRNGYSRRAQGKVPRLSRRISSVR
jgi:hypothetical protein